MLVVKCPIPLCAVTAFFNDNLLGLCDCASAGCKCQQADCMQHILQVCEQTRFAHGEAENKAIQLMESKVQHVFQATGAVEMARLLAYTSIENDCKAAAAGCRRTAANAMATGTDFCGEGALQQHLWTQLEDWVKYIDKWSNHLLGGPDQVHRLLLQVSASAERLDHYAAQALAQRNQTSVGAQHIWQAATAFMQASAAPTSFLPPTFSTALATQTQAQQAASASFVPVTPPRADQAPVQELSSQSAPRPVSGSTSVAQASGTAAIIVADGYKFKIGKLGGRQFKNGNDHWDYISSQTEPRQGELTAKLMKALSSAA